MKRSKSIEYPDFIFCADMHLRDTVPESRTDDFLAAQWKKIAYITELQKKYHCPVIHAGDLFEHWKASPALITKSIQLLPSQFTTILGNHDLPNHNVELAENSAVVTLEAAGRLKIQTGGVMYRNSIVYYLHYGQGVSLILDTVKKDMKDFPDYRKILIWHVMTYQGKKLYPGMMAPSAAKLLRKYPQFDLIVTGHNHIQFIEELDGRYMINPGSTMRTRRGQEKHIPSVFLYFARTNSLKKIVLPYENDVLHISINQEKKEARDTRIDAFISKLQSTWDIGLDFDKNVEKAIVENDIKGKTKQLINQCLEV